MSLHFPLQVNGRLIGQFEAVRIWPDTTVDPDELCRYKVTIYTDATPAKADSVWTGEVKHRVSDGAWSLVLTALFTMVTGVHPTVPKVEVS